MSKTIPIKNYIYLILIIIFSIALIYYLYLWFVQYNKEQENVFLLENYMQIINKNELEDYLTENKNAVIYVTTTDDYKAKQLEKKLRKLIKEHNIENQILYLDATGNSKYTIYNFNFNVPNIVKVQNAQVVNQYSVRNDNYNIDKIEEYLTDIGVINND